MKDLLAERPFRLLLAAQSLTMLGDVALFLVLGIWVKDLTGSSGAAGAVFFALMVSAFLAPVGGVLVDRFPRRKVMIVNDIATGVIVLALLGVRDASDVWIIYVVAFLYGISQQIFFAARSGLLVTMLPRERLGEANGLLESLRQGLRVFGPLLGAASYAAFGGGVTATIDSLTFFGSALLLSALRVDEPMRRREVDLKTELLTGWRHIIATPALRVVIGAVALVLAAMGFLHVALFALVDEGLGRTPAFIGVLATIQGVGSIVGGVLAGRAMARFGEVPLLGMTLALGGIGLALLTSTSMPVLSMGLVLYGIGIAGHLVAYFTLIQRKAAGEMQGRVFSAAEAVLTAPLAGALALGAVAIAHIDYRLIYAVNAVVLVIVGVWLYRWRDPTPSGEIEEPAEGTIPLAGAPGADITSPAIPAPEPVGRDEAH